MSNIPLRPTQKAAFETRVERAREIGRSSRDEGVGHVIWRFRNDYGIAIITRGTSFQGGRVLVPDVKHRSYVLIWKDSLSLHRTLINISELETTSDLVRERLLRLSEQSIIYVEPGRAFCALCWSVRDRVNSKLLRVSSPQLVAALHARGVVSSDVSVKTIMKNEDSSAGTMKSVLRCRSQFYVDAKKNTPARCGEGVSQSVQESHSNEPNLVFHVDCPGERNMDPIAPRGESQGSVRLLIELLASSSVASLEEHLKIKNPFTWVTPSTDTYAEDLEAVRQVEKHLASPAHVLSHLLLTYTTEAITCVRRGNTINFQTY
eukprot:Rmarinus@m.29634